MKQLIKFTLIIFVIFTFIGCMSRNDAYVNLQKTFPNTEIIQTPIEDVWLFIVIDSTKNQFIIARSYAFGKPDYYYVNNQSIKILINK